MRQLYKYVLFLSFIFVVSNTFADQPGDEHWDYRFGFPGTSYYQYAVAVDPRNGDVYAAGDQFTMAGGARTTTNIAKWTRSTGRWSGMGTGLATSSNGRFAEVMAVDPRNGDLYVAGTFSIAGGASVSNLAKWNGTSWSRVGTGTTGGFSSMAFDPVSGDLYVGGGFGSVGGVTASNIAKWNGTTWTALGSGIDNEVVTLSYDQTTSTLYAGGQFTTAGGKPIKGLAKWNGSDWDSVGGVFYKGSNTGRVYSVFAKDGKVYVTGDFTKIGSANISYVAQWNGSAWSQIGALNLSNTGGARTIASIGNEVFIGGSFYISGTPVLAYIARWDGSSWSPVAGGIQGYASVHVEKLVPYGDDLIVCAPQMSATATIAARNYAMYNVTTQQWHQIGGTTTQGIDHFISGMTLGPDNSVYIVGGFKGAGSTSSPGIARWDGTSWNAVSKGMIYALSSSPEAKTIGIAPNGDIYVGGKVSKGINDNGSVTAATNNILKYSGGSWSSLGTGLDNDAVNAIAFSNSDVYVGGNFKVYSNTKIRYIAKWNGSAWDSVGVGIPFNNTVSAIAIAGNGDIYAGGNFTSVGGNTAIKYLAKFNGTSWDSVGGLINGQVRKLKFKGNDLYMCGDFTTIGDNPISGLAKWNGTAWDTVTSGISNVGSFDFQGDTIFASGVIHLADASTVTTAYWDGTMWNKMGTGLQSENQLGGPSSSNAGNIIAVGGDVYFAGGFNIAGNKPSYNFARWNSGETISAVHELERSTLPGQFTLEQNYPNPFNPKTDLRFEIRDMSFVTLKIYDLLGREIETLINEQMQAGSYSVDWNASSVPSGVYFYRLQAGDFSETKRMILMK